MSVLGAHNGCLLSGPSAAGAEGDKNGEPRGINDGAKKNGDGRRGCADRRVCVCIRVTSTRWRGEVLPCLRRKRGSSNLNHVR